MSIRIMTQVWDNRDEWLQGSRRLVLLALADNANDEGVCWPSINTIALKVNLSRRYTIDILNELEEKKYIERNQEQRSSTVYTLRVASEAHLTTSSEAGRTILVRPASPEPPINPKEEPKTPAAQPAAERTPFVLAMEHLELTFSQARRTKLPDWKADPKMCNKRWRTPLKEIWELCGKDTGQADILIQEAVSHMLKDNLTFDAPDQILKVARSIAIDLNNGTHRATAPEPIVQTMQRMGAQYREHVAMKAKLGYAEDEPL